MKTKSEQANIAAIIEKHVSYFNGWQVERETVKRNCAEAAKDIRAYLNRRNGQLKAQAGGR